MTTGGIVTLGNARQTDSVRSRASATDRWLTVPDVNLNKYLLIFLPTPESCK